jgi:multidrug efflux pump subunit AcrB
MRIPVPRAVVRIVLAIPYESFTHPLAILSILPSKGGVGSRKLSTRKQH